MDKPWNEPLPPEELERFRALKDVQVVFDVGARTSLDYLEVFPNAEYHLFEPWPPFYQWLQEECKDKPNVHVNPYGLADIALEAEYNKDAQSFLVGSGEKLPLKTLNWYVKKNNIKRIDFLKIDAERCDYKVLQGGSKAVKLARYIQYETWDDPENEVMRDLLEDDFDLQDVGSRNIFCTRKI